MAESFDVYVSLDGFRVSEEYLLQRQWFSGSSRRVLVQLENF